MTLHLNLFGGFEARYGTAAPLAFPRRKAEVLLAYLALEPAQPHSRAKLAALLWSEAPTAAAGAGLRQALVAIRQVVGDAPPPLIADAGSLRIDLSHVEVDVLRFERLASDEAPASLAEAATLYRGPLLEGIGPQSAPFEEWLRAARERLHETALGVLARLVAKQAAAGELEAAVRTAARLLALDPLQEAVHRTLMRLYARQGRRASALRQYQSCVDVLRHELDTEPEPETKQLYRTLLAAAAPSDAREGAAHRPPAPPLVGRRTEAACLRDAVQRAVEGRGQTLVLVGEAGIGKSRLVAEVLDVASAQDVHVFAGHAYESEQILPFGVWVQALRSGAAVTASMLRELDPVWRAELARLVPELAPAHVQAPAREDHLRLFDAMARLLGHLASHRPVVVVLEDVHWADSMSLRLLPFLMRRTAACPVLLLATAREEDLGDAPALASALDEIRRDAPGAIITLAPLSRDDTTALVSAHTAHAARRPELLEHAWRLSEGNPFVALEAVRAWGDDAGARPPEEARLPDRVRSLIRRRMERLGPAARKLADAAAVIGRDFEFRLLCHVVGMNDHDAADGLEELVRHRIVRLAGENFAFAHDRLRHAVYAALLPPARAALHLDVARAIEQASADRLEEVYDRLGHHYTRTDESERALTYLAKFAEQASRRYALVDAVAALQEARNHVGKLPASARTPRLVELLAMEASYLFYLGRTSELRALLERYEEALEAGSDSVHAGRCFVWLGTALALGGELDAANGHAARAIAVAARAGDRVTQGQGCAVLALSAFWSGTPLLGVGRAREAVAFLGGRESVEWLFYAHLYAAVNGIQLGDFDAAVDANAAASRLAEEADSARLRTFAAWSTGWADAARGHAAAAVEACGRAVSLAPDPLGLANALGFLGYARLEGGDASAARTALEEAVSRAAQCGLVPQQGWFEGWLADAHLATGDRGAARAGAARAEELCRRARFPYGIGVAQRAAARTALADGDPAAASAGLQHALRTFAAIPARHEVVRTERELAALGGAAAGAAVSEPPP